MTIRKLLFALLCLVFMVSISIPVFASNLTKDVIATSVVSENETLSKIEKVIVQFYENKDMGTCNDISVFLDKKLAAYLADKINTQNYATRLYNTEKENYAVQVILINKERCSTELHFTFQVISTYNYVGCKDFDTEVSEEVRIIYDCENDCITDFYTPLNYYDEAIRESYSDNPLLRIPAQDIAHNQTDLKNDIDRVHTEESTISTFDDYQESSRYSSLVSANIVSYARNNYYKSQPSSGNGVVPYYDFSNIPNNWDCTNFVSHALLAGGANVYDTGGNGISSTGWYYRNINNRSSSWSSVTFLYNYLINNTHANAPTGISSIYSHNLSAWATGDILQLKFYGNSDYGHSTIITQKKYSKDGSRAYAYVTGRTSGTQYNNNQAADDMAPGGSKRTIYVYNY
ncbi:MAG: amidase domain-containing protein [Firmicutes bacterium]|nr:amidase domain-containing protein [Bacillota bacterium]